MFWADKIAKKIIKSGKHKPYWVDDMKTPSGRVHVGSLRGVVIHDLIYKALTDAGAKATSSYVIDDHDPMDNLPVYLDQKKYQEYMGQPFYKIPSPKPNFKSYGEYYAQDFIDVFNSLGAKPKIIWASELYLSGKMNQGIRACLNNAAKIREIYKKVSGSEKEKDWHPFQVICPKCGKVGSTKVYDWDGEQVSFRCLPDLVTWAKGCGHSGKMSPFDGNGKLPWKVEWGVKWQAIGVTIEGAGKDHMNEGGSHGIATEICKKVINYSVPFAFSHEFFLIGGRKMSSSKGLGSSAREMFELLPPEILRFLMARTPYQRAINFDPGDNTIPDLFDEYDKCAQAWFKDGRKSDLGRAFELSQADGLPKNALFLPRFRDVANYIQMPSFDLKEFFEKEKGSKFSQKEKEILNQRVKYAKIWLDGYAPKEAVFRVTQKIPNQAGDLSDQQKSYLKAVSKMLKAKDWQPEKLQYELYEKAKKLNIKIKDAFQAIYLTLIGKTHGPKAAWLLLEQDKKFIQKRLQNVQTFQAPKKEERFIYPDLNRPDLFTVSPDFKKKFPSVTVGLAIIRNVEVKKENRELQKEISEFLHSAGSLTTTEIGHFSELKSYRRIYKKTGIDWHSRRPSPEALLRRIAQGKDLYTINTCVDAYNLVVMKHRVSAGAFDFNQMKFPTILRFAKEGEKITLLGDKKPTEYKEGEVAYFDQIGGYNIDFNYLDAERTAITLKTKNLWINVEGVYEITRNQVEKSLKEVIEKITRYCGGEIEMAGIVAAS